MRTTTSPNPNEIHSQTNSFPDSATIIANAQSEGLTILSNKSPSFFEPTPRLVMIDSLLEAMSAKYDNESPNSRDQAEPAEPSWMSNGAIYELAQSAQITPSEAFEYLRRCHNCGSKLAVFGSVYCKEICQQCCEDSHCDCFWGDSCQVCTSGEFMYWNLLDSTFNPEECQDELPSELTIYLEDPSRTSADPYAEPDCSWCWQYHCKYLSILSCRNPKCELCYCNICDDNDCQDDFRDYSAFRDYRGFRDYQDYEDYLDSRDIYDYHDNEDGYDFDNYHDNHDNQDNLGNQHNRVDIDSSCDMP